MGLFRRAKNFFNIEQAHGTDLLESPWTKVAHIEFTSRCNLRCVFCYASQPEYKGMDLDVETMENVIEALKTRNPKVVCVNGHGETTIYKDWHLYCNKMLNAGIPLHIISNFAREFSYEELKTLSRFKSIEISCDTNDPKLFRKMRRGADLKTLCLNILRLQMITIKEGRKSPNISFSCVVSDQNVLNLLDYVAFGKALGVTYFNFCNLTKYPDLEHTLNPKHITEMPVELLHEVEASLTETFEFLESSNIGFHFQQGLMDTFKEKIQNLNGVPAQNDSTVKESEVEKNEIHGDPEKMESVRREETGPHRYSSTSQEAQTRDCLDPWEFIMVQANKDVLPCCWHQPIYSLGSKQSLSEVFNKTQIKKLRREILTGRLSLDCMNCPSKGWTTIDNLQKKVWHYLNPGIYKLLFPKIPDIKPDILQAFKLVYDQGWYDSETNLNIKNPDWQRWRWTSKKAVCLLKNPKRDAILIIRGSIDKLKHEEQTIIIKIKDKILDEFIPGTAKFFKEYALTPGIMGNDDSIELTLETDKTFIPSVSEPQSEDKRELGMQIYELFLGEKLARMS